jgi:HK97 family phage portal protein
MCNDRLVVARRSTLQRAARPPAASPVTPAGIAGATSSIDGTGGGGAMVWTGGAAWPTALPAVATPTTVLGLPAAWRAVNLIAGTCCQLPLIDRQDDGGIWPARPVLTDPWPLMGYAEWITYQVHALLILGDAIALPADFDADGFPRQLVPIDPRYVAIRVDDATGAVLYDVYTRAGILTLGRSDVWHAKGLVLTSDGLRGVGVITALRCALSNALQLQQYGANVYGQGVPSGVVKVHLREVSQEQATDIKTQWQAAFIDRVPAVLSDLMDFTPIAWSPEDAQYLEAKRMSVADVAMAFNLDPTDLDTSLGSSLTYANREQRAYERLLTSIGPLLARVEQAYRFATPRGHTARFDRSAVLWSDAQTRANVEMTELNIGAVTLNEVREANGRERFGSWADEPWGKPPGQQPLPPPAPDPAALPAAPDPAAPPVITTAGGQ